MSEFSGDYGANSGAPQTQVTQGSYAYALRLRGLPWSATPQDISDFLENRVETDAVTIVIGRDGRPSGEAVVGFADESDWTFCRLKHKQHMGKRYVEVYDSSVEEFEQVRYENQSTEQFSEADDSSVLKVRGLPFSATDQDIIDFFEGCAVNTGGIVICLGPHGSPNGEALIQFEDSLSAEKGLGKHKQNMGQRYIEVFKATQLDYRRAVAMNAGSGRGGPMRHGRSGGPRSAPYGRRGGFDDSEGLDDNGQYKHIVHVRGLPYRATEREITSFFRPLETLACRIIFGRDGRPSGEADVAFFNHGDAQEAMAKNKQNIGSRYVELFLRSRDDSYGSYSDDYAWGGSNNRPRGGGYGGGRGGGGYGGRGGGYGGRGGGGYGGY